jgi:hypothetical protein
MNIETVVAAFLPQVAANRVLRLIEFASNALVPDQPPPPGVRRVDMTGSRRPLNLTGAVRSAITDEPAAPEIEKPRDERQRAVELAPGSRALVSDCCKYGSMMARRERPGGRVAITSSDAEIFGDRE